MLPWRLALAIPRRQPCPAAVPMSRRSLSAHGPKSARDCRVREPRRKAGRHRVTVATELQSSIAAGPTWTTLTPIGLSALMKNALPAAQSLAPNTTGSNIGSPKWFDPGSHARRSRPKRLYGARLSLFFQAQRTPLMDCPPLARVIGQLTTMLVTSKDNSFLSSAASNCSSDFSSRARSGFVQWTSTTRQSGL